MDGKIRSNETHRKIKNVYRSTTALELFLSICAGNDTVRAIMDETGLSKSEVYDYLGEMTGPLPWFVKKEPKKYVDGKRRIGRIGYIYKPNLSAVLELNVDPSNNRSNPVRLLTYSFRTNLVDDIRQVYLLPENRAPNMKMEVNRILKLAKIKKGNKKLWAEIETVLRDIPKAKKKIGYGNVRLIFDKSELPADIPAHDKEYFNKYIPPTETKSGSYSRRGLKSEIEKELTPALEEYLKMVVKNSYWRGERWVKKNTPATWLSFILLKRREMRRLDLCALADLFIEYVIVNRQRLVKKYGKNFEEKFQRYLEDYHSPHGIHHPLLN
jgi:hypothetical protein